jgi:hypothetical protein
LSLGVWEKCLDRLELFQEPRYIDRIAEKQELRRVCVIYAAHPYSGIFALYKPYNVNIEKLYCEGYVSAVTVNFVLKFVSQEVS